MLTSGDVLGADTVIFDLEDAVALDEKDAARVLVREALKFLDFDNTEVTVRINPVDSPYWEADLEEMVPVPPDGIVIPKANVEAVSLVENKIEAIKAQNGIEGHIPLLLIIEDPKALMDVSAIAQCSPSIEAIMLGAEDYSSSMGIQRTKGSKEIEYARFVIATAAKAYGLEGVDTPYTDTDDMEGLKADTAFAKSIGLTGRILINPRQVPIVHRVFSPTEEEIDEALTVLELAQDAADQGLGVFSYKGKMVDLPVIKRAEQTRDSAMKWGLIK